MALSLPRETSMRTSLSMRNGMSAVKVAAQAVNVLYAVAQVVTIFPHSGEGGIADRVLERGRRLWDMNFDNGAFFELHVLQGAEDAVLEFSGHVHLVSVYSSAMLSGR